MRPTYQKPETTRPRKKKSKFSQGMAKLLGGDFILLITLYRKEILIGCLIIIVGFFLQIHNANKINEKKETRKKLESEYREAISTLKQNNKFIPYEENQILLQMLAERGFVKSEKNCYKIPVATETEEE